MLLLLGEPAHLALHPVHVVRVQLWHNGNGGDVLNVLDLLRWQQVVAVHVVDKIEMVDTCFYLCLGDIG